MHDRCRRRTGALCCDQVEADDRSRGCPGVWALTGNMRELGVHHLIAYCLKRLLASEGVEIDGRFLSERDWTPRQAAPTFTPRRGVSRRATMERRVKALALAAMLALAQIGAAAAQGTNQSSTSGGVSQSSTSGGSSQTSTSGGISQSSTSGGSSQTSTSGGIGQTSTSGGSSQTSTSGGINQSSGR